MTHPPSTDAGASARRLLLRALRRRRRHVLLSLVGGVLYLASLLVIPLLSKRTIDGMLAGESLGHLAPMLVAMVAMGVLRAAGGMIRKWHAGRLMALVGVDLRDALYRHFQRLSFAFHDRVGPGDLLSRLSSDATAVEEMMAFVPFVAQSVVLGVGGAVMLFVLHPPLALAIVVAVGVAAVLPLRLARRLHPIARSVQDRLGEFSHFVEQQVRGIRVVKGQGSEVESLVRGTRLVDHLQQEATGLVRLQARFLATFMFSPTIGILVVVGVGGWLGARGMVSAGLLVAFLQYLGLLVAPVMIGAYTLMYWPEAVGAAGRIAEVLEVNPDVTSPPHPEPFPAGPATVTFEDVTFGYLPGRPVLHGLTLEIAGGSSVALIGVSGAGKSTIAHLLPRFYDPWQGDVRLDGVSLRAVDLEELRRSIAIVFEHTVIFGDTIRANIALGRPTASDEEIREAARRAHADEFIDGLPEGYDTVVGEHGATLSGGQRQRIAIARAILTDPRVLILDDAMSAVDPRTDLAIRQGLEEVVRGRTTIVVAHRVETLSLVDRVVLLEHGQVVASGSHEELLDHAGYRRALALDDVAFA